MSDFGEVLDALDVVIAHAGAVLDEHDLVVPAAATAQLRQRRGFLGATLVIALAGGTGVGKSSVLNALAGAPVASVSALRPHTDEAMAWVPTGAEPGFAGLLDKYGIRRRVAQDRYPGIAVIDLPDYDSVVTAHRVTVARLVPEVDMVAWVVDPEKYRDQTLFREYLAPLAAYQDQFLFVFNQVDRLGDHVQRVIEDFSARLRDAGIGSSPVFATAAAPPGGAPYGLEPLDELLGHRLDAKRVALGKLAADVRAVAARVSALVGMEHGASIDFEERWRRQRAAVADILVSDPSHGARSEALCRIEDFVAAVAVETGAGFGHRVREAMPPEHIDAALAAAVDATLAVELPEGRGRRARRRHDAERRHAVEGELESAVAGPLRAVLWPRAMLGAALAGLGVDLAGAERKAGLTG